jgi:hypothetical protein
MGVQLHFWKPVLLLLGICPVAGVAPVAGPVAFVGLAAPHIARLLRPSGVALEIALTAAIGAMMVTCADFIARTIAIPKELPVGIITALLGGPIFIYLIQRGRVAFKERPHDFSPARPHPTETVAPARGHSAGPVFVRRRCAPWRGRHSRSGRRLGSGRERFA